MNRAELIEFMQEAERRGDMEAAKAALVKIESLKSPPPPTTLADQVKSAINGPTVDLDSYFKDYNAQKGTETRRQLGLGARSGAKGLLDTVGIFSNPIAYGMNKAGIKTPYAGEMANKAADAVGLPKPESPMEKNVALGSELLAGIGGQAGAANKLAQGATGPVKGLLQSLGGQPAPKAAIGPNVQLLRNEGVSPTVGQVIGGAAKTGEEAARSMPLLGSAVAKQHTRVIEEFNRAAINRALKPIGEKMGQSDEVGYTGVKKAYQKISATYDKILPKLDIKIDNAFVDDINKLSVSAKKLPPDRATQLENILQQDVLDKFNANGTLNPKTMKQVISGLGKDASDYMKSLDGDQQRFGLAIKEVQTALSNMVARGNPKYAKQLKGADEAYANLLRVENASARQGAKDGIFTPNQLEQATRALDNTLRKRGSAHGDALMQDLATAGDKVITNKLPDSGTAARTIWNAAGLGSGYIDPMIPAGLLGAASLYTNPVQKGLTGLLTKKPGMVSGALRAGSPLLFSEMVK